MMWHQVFGIEVDTAALLSPTHLLLMTGGLLMATALGGLSHGAYPREKAAELSTGAVFLSVLTGVGVSVFAGHRPSVAVHRGRPA